MSPIDKPPKKDNISDALMNAFSRHGKEIIDTPNRALGIMLDLCSMSNADKYLFSTTLQIKTVRDCVKKGSMDEDERKKIIYSLETDYSVSGERARVGVGWIADALEPKKTAASVPADIETSSAIKEAEETVPHTANLGQEFLHKAENLLELFKADLRSAVKPALKPALRAKSSIKAGELFGVNKALAERIMEYYTKKQLGRKNDDRFVFCPDDIFPYDCVLLSVVNHFMYEGDYLIFAEKSYHKMNYFAPDVRVEIRYCGFSDDGELNLQKIDEMVYTQMRQDLRFFNKPVYIDVSHDPYDPIARGIGDDRERKKYLSAVEKRKVIHKSDVGNWALTADGTLYLGYLSYGCRLADNEEHMSFDTDQKLVAIRDKIKQIRVDDRIFCISAKAFQNAKKLFSVVFPEKLKRIEEAAFENTGIHSLRLPSRTVYIGKAAFRFCNSLKSVFIPSTVCHVDDYAFFGCTNLRNVEFEELLSNLNQVGAMAFYGCTKLRNVTFPAMNGAVPIQIRKQAFAECPQLRDEYLKQY